MRARLRGDGLMVPLERLSPRAPREPTVAVAGYSDVDSIGRLDLLDSLRRRA